jgi:DNA-binding MarR family transcriptional regulator
MYVISRGGCGGILVDFLIAEAALLMITVVASVLFYRRIRGAQEEYEASREVTKNIVVSFSRELSKEAKRRESVGEAAKAATEESAKALRMSEETRSEVKDLSNKMDKATQELEVAKSQIEALSQKRDSKERTIEKKAIEEKVKAEPPSTPRRAEGILNKLNSTEFMVLDILDKEGEITVPKIRGRIGKTREHTARLLKKLYDNGFIDRVTGSMPYKYKIRKELKDLIAEQKGANIAS